MKAELPFTLKRPNHLRRPATLGLSALICMSTLFSAQSLAATIPSADSLAVADATMQNIKEKAVYLVRLKGDPVVAYTGDIKGLKATKPAPNKKIDPNSPAVTRYADYLTAKHDALLSSIGATTKRYSYKYSYNGFAAELNAAQVRALLKNPEVLSVVEDELLQPDTVSTYEMLKLNTSDGTGLWEKLGGVEGAGENVVVGIIDSGIWPESESFSDRTGSNSNGKTGKLAYQQLPGWHGKCVPGEAFAASDCNQKLISAQWFNAGFGGDSNIKNLFPYEFVSARDADGHGTHTASTAAGNYGVNVTINGSEVGTASGMAPRARVAAYKVCWGRDGEGGCFGSDSVAAIDQAVADGVDVLNFSISGSRTSFLDQVEVAFLFAADAGVYVSASAGNSGPASSTVAHNSPWLTTVAASTHDRGWEATITTLGDGTVYDGVSLGGGVGPAPMVYSANAGLEGEDPEQSRLCYPGTLDPGVVTGKIVVCDRGIIARVAKSEAVAEAGGVGMVLANVVPSSLNADFHSVPSIHVDVAAGDALRDYAINMGEEGGVISAGSPVEDEAPFVASFSSRGPALAGAGDLLKPDILAPGVDVIAAVSPEGYGGENFGALSGTSMSSPHMAGLGALMKQAHPSWSPAAIKSAFMTSATRTNNKGNPIPGNAFGYGAGFVQPNEAVEPGLVYDADFNDYVDFLCGTGSLDCGGYAPEPSDLNYPSIAIGALAGSQTVTRIVTSVSDSHATYTPEVDGLTGIATSFDPEVIEIAPGESVQYQVTFTNVSAPINTYVTGGITWVDGEQRVRSAVALKPVVIGIPAEVTATGESGSLAFDINFGYSGAYSAATHGLAEASTVTGMVADDPNNSYNAALGTCDFSSFPFACVGITWHAISVPAGAQLVRISLFNNYTDGTDDLDLYVYNSSFSFVGSSGSGSSAEQVDVIAPGSTTYYVAVHGWQTDGADANYTLFSWGPQADLANTTVDAPNAATSGTTETITVEWEGLSSAKYLGVISHSDGGGVIGRTIVNIQND